MKCWMDNCAGRRIARWFVYRTGTSNITTEHWHMQADPDLDKLGLEHLIITMATCNGEDWAKRIRLDKMERIDDTVENTEDSYTK